MSDARPTRRGRWATAAVSATLVATMMPTVASAAEPVATAAAPAVTAAAVDDPKNVLIFTETTQFRHTEAIDQGVPLLQAALTAEGITSEWSNDSTGFFTPEKLATFDAVVLFNASGDPWSAAEKEAFIAYQQAGGSTVGVHNATDMRSSWAWYDDMVGTLMPGHAATGTSPGPTGVVRVEDRTHPSTDHLAQRWQRGDEWYNYSTNVRGTKHVLATLDETTYAPGGNAMGYDHPISWCDNNYDGGKVWMTGMGHFGAHYSEPALMGHIVGGISWASGKEAGDCGGTDWENFEKVALDTNTSAPFAIDVLPDGRVVYTELVRGQIQVYNPTTQETSTAATIPVYSGGEDGLLGIAADPNFADNGYLYVYYAPASTNDSDPANFFSRVSRFTMNETTGTIDLATERVLISFPARRLPDEPGHTGGGLDFDIEGNLLIGIGDDVNPHSEPSGGYAPLSTRNGTFHDARETSANTNDLRGKVLRITPKADVAAGATPGIGTSYEIPEGNLFAVGTAKTRPEIYAMGFRNPFRFSVDPVSGAVGVADYSPDNGNDAPATRGPAGIAEWNLISEPGFYGWPLCMGNNEPFRNVDYGTTSAGPVVVKDFFDCNAPINDSPRNTGLTELPAAQPADMWYGYRRSSTGAIPQGGGLAPMGGPFYNYDANLVSDTKFPEYYDGKPFFYDWARNRMFSIDLKDPAAATGSQVEKVNPFLPQTQFLAPIDSKFGPDGALYVLDWGGGYGRDNPNSGLHRIDYISGSRSPVASFTATPDTGAAPLEVSFDGSASSDPENEEITFAWDFNGDGTVDSTEEAPTYTYAEVGQYSARLTVTDPHGKEGTVVRPITVGNTRPVVEFNQPLNGAFFEFGDELDWAVTVTDAEDGSSVDGDIAAADVIVQPALGHDYHAHPTAPQTGFSGTTVTSLGGHDPEENIFYVIDARYTDKGAGEAPALTGSATTLMYPKKRQAEFFSTSDAITRVAGGDIEGYGQSISGQNGAWAAYDPINLIGIDSLGLRIASATDTTVELRKGAADGELLGTATVPRTGSLSRYTDVQVEVTDPGESFVLYVVFPGAGERRINFIEGVGQGISPEARAAVAISSHESYGRVELEPQTFVADVTAGATPVASVEFFIDGTSIGTDASAPYQATWTPTEETQYQLKAVVTDTEGNTVTSRIVVLQVGEPYGPFETFTNVNGQFTNNGGGSYTIAGAGSNMWQGVDQYSSLFVPGGADEDWVATVKINSQTNTNGGAKAGIFVRNDVTAPGSSTGYGAIGQRPSGGFEWLRDMVAPFGQLDASNTGGTSGYPSWVRLSRDGADYQAAWSRDGVTFTNIGGPVQLPGAASVQDIGLFVTAHSGNVSTVNFSDWTFDDDPTTEPEEPETPPSCVGLRSDEFDGTAVDTSRWTTVRNATGRPITVSGGNAVLPITTGDINEASTGPISYLGQPLPAGAWTVQTSVTMAHTQHWQWGGLLLHQNDDNYVKLAFVKHQNGNRFLEFQAETNGTRTTPAAPVLPTTFPTTAHLRLTSNGTTITGSYSADGTTWTNLAGSLAVKPNSTVGIAAAGDLGTTPLNASFNYFRMDPPGQSTERSFDDEFEGTAIDTCRWDNIVRYDSSKLAVAGGELRITTQPGDINNNNPITPRNFVLQSAPEGDWTVETKFKAPLVHQWQLAGLLAYANDDNYVKLDVVARNAAGSPLNLGAELVSEKGGTFGNGGNRLLDIADSSESGYWYLRLQKVGNTYQGWVSDGGVNWTSIGAPVTNDVPLTHIGLMAIGPDQTTPVTVAFDYFKQVVEEPADTTAPVTTAVVSDADPAVVTLTATDEEGGSGVESTQFRLAGAPEWSAYTAPVSVPRTAAVQVFEFRSIDAAGNEEAVKSVEIAAAIPTEAPAEITTAGACLAGKSVLTVRVRNTHTEPVTFTITSPLGTKTFANVKPKGLAAHNFSATGSYPAGEVTITATVGGQEVGSSTSPYGARTCG